ncbi:hypothetical protein TNIN_418141 [Trichonephila inaurata madagascariensis]|uniref:Uncharacterized protein n=1 Tax=Trichonephila inaurata madagascariensis TaxID=2747483 RepID=A0A8X6YAL6_9ARAC|nr:hypothetical protein TNIN_418141 [Trichonephila inaurata madagascariensis]
MHEIKEGKESEESTPLRYFGITRHVLLKSLALFNGSPKLDFHEELQPHEFSDIAEVVNNILRIFRDDFDKILEAGDNIYRDPEIEYVQFLLSRCKLLCLQPTYSSFLLVCAFLCNLILGVGENIECFRILYITEFCFVLNRRFFEGFNDGYQNLQKYSCYEFRTQILHGLYFE